MQKVAEHLKDAIRKARANGETPPKIHLEGGYFDVREGATEFSRNSLLDVLSLAEELISEFQRDARLSLGILVNDIHGSGTNVGSCRWHLLESDIENILNHSRIVRKETFVVSTEKRCKNRGANTVKKVLKRDEPIKLKRVSFEKDGEKIYFQHRSKDIFLGERYPKKIVVKCPVITAQNYLDISAHLDRRYGTEGAVCIVDVSSRADQANVTNGARLARALSDRELNIANVFYNQANAVGHSVSLEEWK